MESCGVKELARGTEEEKQSQLRRLKEFHQRNSDNAPAALERLYRVALSGGNIFEELMETVKYCSLGQITDTLFKAGGQYRRNM
jgi:methylmalonyl-CoA mutase